MRISRFRRLIAAIVGVGVSLYLASCAPPVRTLVEGPSVAFGKVELIYEGKKIKNLEGMEKATGVGVVLLRPDQKKAQYLPFAGSGEYYWTVGPGEYRLISFQYMGGGARHNIHLGARFTVPGKPGSVYLGDLIVEAGGRGVSISVEDRRDEAISRLRQAYPEHPQAIISDLIRVEPPLGRFSSVLGVCAAAWGVACQSQQFGVVPKTPAHEAGLYRGIDTLTPIFEWTPSARPEVHYDLVVRDAISCEGLVLFKEGLPGDVVVYEEDLSQPFHRLEKPLEPDTNYIWSVRLREGDRVSNWSTTGHFAFFIVGASWGSGDWFRFSTPAVR